MKEVENSSGIVTNWVVVKDKLMKQFSTLTEDDFLSSNGTEGEVLDKLEAKLGMPKEEIYAMINQVQ